MSVAVLQRSISCDRSANKHADGAGLPHRDYRLRPDNRCHSGLLCFPVVTEILIAAEDDFPWPKRLCATSDGCIA